MRPDRFALLCAAGATFAAFEPVAAQSLLLRYRPQAGSSVQTLVRTEASTTFGAGTVAAPLLDSLFFETAILTSVTQRVVGHRADQVVVDMSLDSIRARMRLEGGAWRTMTDSATVQGTLRVATDDRLRVREARPLPGGTLTAVQRQLLRGLAGGMELAFPENPVSAGESWSADVVIPLDVPLEYGPETGIGAAQLGDSVLVVRTTVTLDSVVPRATDTLGYLRVRGSVLPAEVTTPDEAMQSAARVTGRLGGSVVWSTGWNAFVTGAIRTVATAQIRAPAAPEIGSYVVKLDAVSRFQVRR
jgi:hypothetical protein